MSGEFSRCACRLSMLRFASLRHDLERQECERKDEKLQPSKNDPSCQLPRFILGRLAQERNPGWPLDTSRSRCGMAASCSCRHSRTGPRRACRLGPFAQGCLSKQSNSHSGPYTGVLGCLLIDSLTCALKGLSGSGAAAGSTCTPSESISPPLYRNLASWYARRSQGPSAKGLRTMPAV